MRGTLWIKKMSSCLTAFPSLRLAAAAIAAAVALSSTSARALTTQEILNYQGPDRQKILEDGARREGTVLIYSGMIVNQLLRPLTEAFEKKYPFIKTRYWRGDGNQILFKVISEMQANAPEADLVEGSGIVSSCGRSSRPHRDARDGTVAVVAQFGGDLLRRP